MPPPRWHCLFSPSRSSVSIALMNEKASVLRPLPRWRGRCIRSIPESSIMYPDARIRSQHFFVSQLSPPAPALVRPVISARALAEYAGLLIAPVNLHMDRDVENHPWGFNPVSLTAGAWRELQTLAGLIVFGVLLWWGRRGHKREQAIFALLLCAGVSYLPVCGLFSLNANIAEHWVYVP